MRFVFQTTWYRLFRQGQCGKFTSGLFNQVKDRLAFRKEDQSCLRGFMVAKFLNAPTTQEWFCGLPQEQAILVLKESIKRWKAVDSVIVCLQDKQHDPIRRDFTNANTFFLKCVRESPITASLASEFD